MKAEARRDRIETMMAARTRTNSMVKMSVPSEINLLLKLKPQTSNVLLAAKLVDEDDEDSSASNTLIAMDAAAFAVPFSSSPAGHGSNPRVVPAMPMTKALPLKPS